VSSAGLPHKRETLGILQVVKQRATEMIKGLEHLSYGERLRDLGLFSLEKRRLNRGTGDCI